MSAEFDTASASVAATVDWTDLSGLDQIVKAFWLGENMIVALLADGREIRITAWLDMGSGQYVAEYEKRTNVSSGGRTVCVWAKTPAYKAVTAEDAQSCLEAAVIEVDRIHVF